MSIFGPLCDMADFGSNMVVMITIHSVCNNGVILYQLQLLFPTEVSFSVMKMNTTGSVFDISGCFYWKVKRCEPKNKTLPIAKFLL